DVVAQLRPGARHAVVDDEPQAVTPRRLAAGNRLQQAAFFGRENLLGEIDGIFERHADALPIHEVAGRFLLQLLTHDLCAYGPTHATLATLVRNPHSARRHLRVASVAQDRSCL